MDCFSSINLWQVIPPKNFQIVFSVDFLTLKLLLENFALGSQLTKEYGEFYRVWIGPELNIVLSDPKDAEAS